jgi:hypothetical protein
MLLHHATTPSGHVVQGGALAFEIQESMDKGGRLKHLLFPQASPISKKKILSFKSAN